MNEEISEALVADMLDDVTANIAAVRDFYERRAQLTAEGHAADKRVTVVVNADALVIETRLAPDADELEQDELAKAFTAAAQQAVTSLRQTTAELLAPIQRRHDRIPKLSELFPGMPDVVEALRVPAASRGLGAADMTEQQEAVVDAGTAVSVERSRLPEVTDRSW